VRLVALLTVASLVLDPSQVPEPGARARQDDDRVAQLASSAAGLFLRLVNERLKGRIDPRAVSFIAPAGVELEDLVLTGPNGQPVARVKRALVQVSVRALFNGEILISKIDIDEPKLLLQLDDGKLNLLEALSPKKPPDPNAKAADATFRIDEINIRGGGFRFTDGDNLTLVFDGIAGRASVDVNLASNVAIVDVTGLGVDSGSVRLKDLDVPLRRLAADRVRVVTDTIDLTGVRAEALGAPGQRTARINVAGRVDLSGDGLLKLAGRVDTDAGAWPDRLEPLSFVTPKLRGDVTINGPFKAPVVSIDGTVGNATISGYAVDGGDVKVTITPTVVTLRDGTALKLGKATARVGGTVKLPGEGRDSAVLDLRARASDLPFGTALAPADLDTTLRGALGADLAITGKAGKETELTIAGALSGRGLQLFDLTLPSPLDGDVRLTVSPSKVTLGRVQLNGANDARVAVSGDVDLKGERLALKLDVSLPDTSAVVSQIPEDLIIRRAQASGTVTGPFKAVVVDVAARVPEGVAYGTSFSTFAANVKASSKEVRVEQATGTFGGGALTQPERLIVSLGKSATTMTSGRFRLTGVDLVKVKTPSGKALPVTGLVTAEATVRGTTKAPRVGVRAAGARMVVSEEELGGVTADVAITLDELLITKLKTSSPMLRATSDLVRVGLKDDGLRGRIAVQELDLSAIHAAQRVELKGKATGSVTLDGNLTVPLISGDLPTKGLGLKGIVFGDGEVLVGLGADPQGPKDGRAALLSATTTSQGARWRVQAAYALDRDSVNADVHFRDLDLSVIAPSLGEKVAPLEGQLSGSVTLRGPLSAPSGGLLVQVPELVADVPGEGGALRKRTLGRVFLGGVLDDGSLAARVCAFPDAAAAGPDDIDSPCEGPHRLWASLGGAVDLRSGAMRLLVDASLLEAELQELVMPLAKKDIGANVRVRLDAVVDMPADGPRTVTLAGNLQELGLRIPGAPPIRLVSPVDIDFVGGRAVIGTEPARFVTAKEGIDLVIAAGSTAGGDDVDVAIDGQLALAALKLFTDDISNASGSAETHVKATGRFDEGILVAGTIEPIAGARITPRSLGQPIVFEAARIALRPDETDLSRLRVTVDSPCGDERSETCPLRATVGSGRVQLKGDLLARTSRGEGQTWIEDFDVALSATGVEVKTSLGRLETSVDLALLGKAPNPVLSGRVDVTDGLLRKEFQVRNFILTQAPERPSTPLWQTLTPIGLGEMRFDLLASMQNVRTKARINAFSVDTSLRGDLRISETLRFPGVAGAIEVESGTVDFPRARFDVIEMQVQFPTTADGSLKPVLHIAARAELPPGAAGNQVEVPVDLSLDGSFDAMQLDLTATDPARQWTRAELFAHILFGVVPNTETGADLIGTSVDVASRAALRELAAPVNREVEALVESGLGVHVNIDVVSGFQLQLGRRLVLEGPGLLSQALGTSDSTTSTTAGTSGTDALRVRLLFYDHLPIGRAVSAEGRFGLVSDLRLSWRLVEQ